MNVLKKRLAVLLCTLLALPAIVGVLPHATLETQAAGYSYCYVSWNSFRSEMDPQTGQYVSKVTIGKDLGKVNLAEYGTYTNYSNNKYASGYMSENTSVKYSSSNTKVATIDSKGVLTPKAAGTTRITVTYRTAKNYLDVKVVSSTKAPKTANKLIVKAKAVKNAYGKEITRSNRYAVANALGEYVGTYEETNLNISYNGVENKIKNNQVESILRLPDLSGVSIIREKMSSYQAQYNPVATGGPKKLLKVTSISGKGNVVSAKLSQKLTSDQIFAIKYEYGDDTELVNSKDADFPVYVKDTNTGHKYAAVVSVKEGSKDMQITLKRTTLKKGHTYKLTGSGAWVSNGKSTFKSK